MIARIQCTGGGGGISMRAFTLTAGEVVSSMALYLRDIALWGGARRGGGGGDVSPPMSSACHPKTSLARSPPGPASAHLERPHPAGLLHREPLQRPEPVLNPGPAPPSAAAPGRSTSHPGSSRKTGLRRSSSSVILVSLLMDDRMGKRKRLTVTTISGHQRRIRAPITYGAGSSCSTNVEVNYPTLKGGRCRAPCGAQSGNLMCEG